MAKAKTEHATSLAYHASASALRDFRAAKNELSRRYLKPETAFASAAMTLTSAAGESPQDNVVGVGVGVKISDGKSTGALSVKIFVRHKFPESHLSSKSKLPKQIGGLATDVEQVGTFRKLKKKSKSASAAGGGSGGIPNPRARYRPAQPGCSIGYRAPGDTYTMAGTFGAVVLDNAGTIYVLSNNHVLADENRLPLGSPIYQPGLLDGGNVNTDQIAILTRFVPLVGPGGVNRVDCAIAKATPQNIVSRDILYIGPLSGSAAAAIGMQVHKFGRTTDYRTGHITSIDTDVKVTYDIGTILFQNQIIVVGNAGAFSAAGDSGSLILEVSSRRAIGLLFAGSSTHTIANHIADVLASLQVRLA
jgi:hypothetical protein